MTTSKPHRPFLSFLNSNSEVYTKSGKRILLGPDLLRFLSVLAIVWLHGKGPGITYLEISIYCLIFLSIILPTIGKSNPTFRVFAVHRAKRLLVPYAFFWLFYGLLAFIRGRPFFPSPWIIIEGHGWHLWYLPYAFIASIIVFQLKKFSDKFPERTAYWLLIALSMVMLLAAAIFLEHYTGSSRVPRLYMRFAPTIPMGVLVGRVIRNNNLESICWLFILSAGTCFFTDLFQFHGLTELTLPYTTSLLLVSAALLWQQGTSDFMLKATGLAMSIYLLHPAVGFILLRLGIPAIDHENPLFAAAMVFCSIPVGWMSQKTPLLRLFVK